MYKYKLDQKIGSGAFGDVFIAHHIETNERLAIKLMKQTYHDWNQCLELREIKSLLKLKHQNIIALREVFQTEGKLCLVFQYAESNLFQRFLKEQHTHKISEPQIKNLTRQLAQALCYMHKNGFFHRDLKPQNILISCNQYKICDFGLARQIRSVPPYTAYVSTRWYRSPQLVLRMTSYNSPVDIFALGCIIAEMYIGAPLFPGANEADQLAKIFAVMGTPKMSEWPEMYKWAGVKKVKLPEMEAAGLRSVMKNVGAEVMDLLMSMLQVNPKNRITAVNILKHPYLASTIYVPRQIAPTQTDGKKHKKKSSKQATSTHNFLSQYAEEFKQEKIQRKLQTEDTAEQAAEELELSGLIREMEAKDQRKKSIKTQVLKSTRYDKNQDEQPEKMNSRHSEASIMEKSLQTDTSKQTKFIIKKPLAKPWSSVANLESQQTLLKATAAIATCPVKHKQINNDYYQTDTRNSHHKQPRKLQFRGRKLVSVEKSDKKKQHFRTEKQDHSRSSSGSSSKNKNFLKYRFDPNKQPQQLTPRKMMNKLKMPPILTQKKP